MKNTRACNLYNNHITNFSTVFSSAVSRGQQLNTSEQTKVFFRADDIGIPSNNFTRLIKLHKKYRVPLCLAAVPSWLTTTRLQCLYDLIGNENSLFCWHQHGWLHKNHERKGKKYEFGNSRSRQAIHADLVAGKTRLSELLKDNFHPFFTPPWNRCSIATLELLQELGFKGISRSRGASPPVSEPFQDIPINIDLHTRKEKTGDEGLEKMLLEVEHAFTEGTAGFMIHHQLMNDRAFNLLEEIFVSLTKTQGVKLHHFTSMKG